MPPTSESGDFYAGSRLLTPLSATTGLSIDQVNFLVCQLTALALGFPFRSLCSASKAGSTTRHVVELGLGILLVFFCFGYQIVHLFALTTLCYLLIQVNSKPYVPQIVFIVAMGYLAVCHIYRMILDYGGYTLDITGPLMVAVQKVTSVSYALYDGTQQNEKDLTPNMKSKAIKKTPDALSFYSFIFSFHSVMCGPTIFYHDYVAFVDGTCYSKPPDNGNADQVPSPVAEMCKKLVFAVILGALMMCENLVAPWQALTGDSFLHESSWGYRMIYILISMSMHRPMYYFAWKLAEAVNNSCGLGFSGYDEAGNSKWNLLDNVDIWNLETSTSLKVNIESWNILTTHWLRHTVYERFSPSIGTWAVFMISAFWHGFYPGYYIAFLTAALFTTAARLVRRNVRGYFQQSAQLRFFYDAVTFIFTRLANCIMVVPFVMLDIEHSLLIYTSLFWWLHILSAGVIVYFNFIQPIVRPARKDREAKKE
ncbi:lysophospholipid acyltransferase 6-like isoform X2 [Mya arenaria]|uniref:lysophospholipid acyltransferase 6-like isoform X2 n=1 Tax=Mya arenaria TaxID=6604 RepID=UPI0022E32669|nr:lysophospholipid acyltransferase 6-like isoform X2 [Mya arenaria]